MGAEQGPAEVTRRSAAQAVADDLLGSAQRIIHSYLVLGESYTRVTEELAASRREASLLADKLAAAHELIRRLQSAAPAFAELERTMLAELETGRQEPAQPPWERVALGVCPGCDRIVYSGDKFNMHVLSWGADFRGDVPGSRRVFTHRECGNGNHSKDDV